MIILISLYLVRYTTLWLIILTGGRKVWLATSHRPLKMRKSTRGALGVFDFAVRTQKIEGSIWSLEMLPTLTNFSRAYL